MDRKLSDDERWVENQVGALAPAKDWRPNGAGVLARVRDRASRHRTSRQRLTWIAAAASVICLGILAAPASCEAASPQPCRRPLAARLFALFETHQAEAPAELALKSFRVSGSAAAPLTLEIYSDFECPVCAAFYLETMPLLNADFVETGKVRILHRDFPLPQHPYARLAARYANAAGELGQYNVVVNQLFRTQHLWEKTGEVDAQMVSVLPPGLLQKVREMVKTDPETSVTADLAQGRADQIRGTPALVVVARGKRQVIPSMPSYSLLKSYLDSLLRD